MESRLFAGLVLALVVVVACSTTIGSLAPNEAATATGSLAPSDAATASPTPTQAPASIVPSGGSNEAIEAARRLMLSDGAEIAMDVRRQKRESDPIETLITLDGRVEPALGRGQIRVDFSGLFALPGASPSPTLDSVIELVWTPDELFARSPAQPDTGWTARSRADARLNGGVIGRLPDEVDGLVKLVAQGDQGSVLPAADGSIDGQVARRWTLRVPIEDAAAEGVPLDVPNAAVMRDTYGIEAVEIGAWLVDGVLRRLRYKIAREHAAYGGPDRTTVTYDWTPTESAEPIAVPTPAR
jgi:hypothetical protein